MSLTLDQEDSRQFNVHVPVQFEEQIHANKHSTKIELLYLYWKVKFDKLAS